MPAFDTIVELLKQLDTDQRSMPASALYNEGWMLRLVLDAGEKGYLPSYIPRGSNWCSESQLRTPFGRERGTKHESNTHADGVVGDFVSDVDTKSGLEIRAETKLFIVFEAKMYSALSSGTKNAPGYDQAARNVACMAETFRRAGCRPDSTPVVGFYVVAPQTQIDGGLFSRLMTADSIRSRVAERIQQYSGIVRDELTEWQERWFIPCISRMETSGSIDCLSWEKLIEEISTSNEATGADINAFYQKCKQCNRSVSRSYESAGRPTRGMEYWVTNGRYNGQRVRVMSPGKSNSRVYLDGSDEEPFLIANTNLKIIPASEQTPAPADPIIGREYDWTSKADGLVRVLVLNVGDCNSRVVRMSGDETSFKVPNHHLCAPQR